MRWLQLFEDFRTTKVSVQDVIDCIENDGVIYADIIKEYPNNNPKDSLKPIDIDELGNTTVDIDGNLYVVELKDIKKIDFGK